MTTSYPRFRQIVLDATDARGLAEFWRQLLGLQYREGDEPPADGQPEVANFIVLTSGDGRHALAIQPVESLHKATWPEGRVPQQLHVDLSVADKTELDAQHDRALGLGAHLIEDHSDDAEEPIRIYADPAGHPFCIFIVGPDHGDVALL